MMFSTSLTRFKQGQTGHVFTFLFAMIVIIATIWIAGKLIGSFGDTACESEIVEFRNSFKQSLNANSVFGSRNRITTTAPCGAVQLCVVDSRTIQKSISQGGLSVFSSERQQVEVSVRNAVEENVYLFTEDASYPFFDERIILTPSDQEEPDFSLCLNMTRGAFEYSTEGYGRYVRLIS